MAVTLTGRLSAASGFTSTGALKSVNDEVILGDGAIVDCDLYCTKLTFATASTSGGRPTIYIGLLDGSSNEFPVNVTVDTSGNTTNYSGTRVSIQTNSQHTNIIIKNAHFRIIQNNADYAFLKDGGGGTIDNVVLNMENVTVSSFLNIANARSIVVNNGTQSALMAIPPNATINGLKVNGFNALFTYGQPSEFNGLVWNDTADDAAAFTRGVCQRVAGNVSMSGMTADWVSTFMPSDTSTGTMTLINPKITQGYLRKNGTASSIEIAKSFTGTLKDGSGAQLAFYDNGGTIVGTPVATTTANTTDGVLPDTAQVVWWKLNSGVADEQTWTAAQIQTGASSPSVFHGPTITYKVRKYDKQELVGTWSTSVSGTPEAFSASGIMVPDTDVLPVATYDPSAETGIAINAAGTQITISAARTLSQIYTYVKYWLALPANMNVVSFGAITNGCLDLSGKTIITSAGADINPNGTVTCIRANIDGDNWASINNITIGGGSNLTNVDGPLETVAFDTTLGNITVTVKPGNYNWTGIAAPLGSGTATISRVGSTGTVTLDIAGGAGGSDFTLSNVTVVTSNVKPVKLTSLDDNDTFELRANYVSETNRGTSVLKVGGNPQETLTVQSSQNNTTINLNFSASGNVTFIHKTAAGRVKETVVFANTDASEITDNVSITTLNDIDKRLKDVDRVASYLASNGDTTNPVVTGSKLVGIKPKKADFNKTVDYSVIHD